MQMMLRRTIIDLLRLPFGGHWTEAVQAQERSFGTGTDADADDVRGGAILKRNLTVIHPLFCSRTEHYSITNTPMVFGDRNKGVQKAQSQVA